MTKYIMILILGCFSFASLGQEKAILQGASEFRKICLINYMGNLQKIERIRLRMDSLGVNDKDFEKFCNNLNYVSKNLHNGKLRGRQFMVNNLKLSIPYRNLSEKELAFVIANIGLINTSRMGIWIERYPHKLDVKSLRLKQLSQYGVLPGEHILHYSALNNHTSEILFLSYDSVQVSYNPHRIDVEGNGIFDLISSTNQDSSKSLSYIFQAYPKPIDNQLYDKVIFDCMGILFFKSYPDFKKKLKSIHGLLAKDGELIVGAHYGTLMFDGPFPDIAEVDKKIKRILNRGFELKDKIHSENEYLIYKFSKVVN